MPTKIKKTINDKNICIYFKKDDKSVFLIEKNIISIITKLIKLYEIENPKINIELIYSRKELDNKLGYKTPEWLIAVMQNNSVYLFSPSIVEKASSHKKTEIGKILAHEICHVFNNKINKSGLMWVDEGVALFLAKQRKDKNFTKKDLIYFSNNYFDKNIDLMLFAKNNGYKISYWSIENAVKQKGIDIITKLLKINPNKEKCRAKLEKILNNSTKTF